MVAKALLASGTPFLFVTGYDAPAIRAVLAAVNGSKSQLPVNKSQQNSPHCVGELYPQASRCPDRAIAGMKAKNVAISPTGVRWATRPKNLIGNPE